MKPLRVLDRARRRILVHRRLLGACCAAAAVWFVAQAATAPPPRTVPVWTARHDLASGTVLGAGDLRRTAFAPGSVPAHALRSVEAVLGRTLATPLGAGDPVTSADLMGAERLDGYPGRAAVAVRIPDPAVAALLSPGQHVALVASDPQGAHEPERIAPDAAVLAVPRSSSDASGNGMIGGRLVVFAVPEQQADELAAAGASRYLSVVWSR